MQYKDGKIVLSNGEEVSMVTVIGAIAVADTYIATQPIPVEIKTVVCGVLSGIVVIGGYIWGVKVTSSSPSQ
jgi:hypothetical protein